MMTLFCISLLSSIQTWRSFIQLALHSARSLNAIQLLQIAYRESLPASIFRYMTKLSSTSENVYSGVNNIRAHCDDSCCDL